MFGLGLIGLQAGADVVAHVDVGNVDRDDFERRLRIEPAGQHSLGNPVGIGEHVGMPFRRADRADDPLADAGDDRLLGRPADQLAQVRPHRDPGLHLELNAVLGDRFERVLAGTAGRAIDHLRINARLHGFEHVAAGQVDASSPACNRG